MQNKNVSWEVKNKIVYLGFGENESKSMTTLSKETLLELKEKVSLIERDQSQYEGVVFFSHKPDCFLAGVDVEIIQSLDSEQNAVQGCEAGQTIFNQIEDLKIPTVALIDGVCLGGGLELSLSCDFIVASDNSKTKLGLPEVMLGVLPGFGGTYRLPLKIGLTQSLDLILSGKQVDGKKALKLGIADALIPRERHLSLAPSVLKGKFLKKREEKGLMSSVMESIFVRKIIFQKAREKVFSQTKGFYPAPLKILDHLEKSFGRSRKEYLQNEAQAFAQLSQTSQSKNLQHVFFLTDQSKKFDKNKAVFIPSRGAVLGAGTMGGGIAWLLADQQMSPIMKDINSTGLELGLKQASQNFMAALKRKKITEDEFSRKMTSIIPTTNYENFNAVDLVIEAVVEDMNIKKKVFKEVEGYVSKECLLTSNTSSLSVNEMASVLSAPERFAGLHFFNPVHKMPLVEIITHDKISEKTINSLYQWVLKSKKNTGCC
jgi:3-hydroxyacyl-CoA dehydrogenase/enoyl-CoA hydratase/3-hydroxybutyryl-CoA epimerase